MIVRDGPAAKAVCIASSYKYAAPGDRLSVYVLPPPAVIELSVKRRLHILILSDLRHDPDSSIMYRLDE
jgi:hypothetical protein